MKEKINSEIRRLKDQMKDSALNIQSLESQLTQAKELILQQKGAIMGLNQALKLYEEEKPKDDK